jgi:hypothetical protein
VFFVFRIADVMPDDNSFNNTSSDSEGEIVKDGDDSINLRRSIFRIDDWLVFRVDPEAAALVMQLRLKWHSLFLRRMRAPIKQWSQFDESTVRAIVSILTSEEQALGLQQPAGIGQRPRPMSTETVVSSGGSQCGSAEVDQRGGLTLSCWDSVTDSFAMLSHPLQAACKGFVYI